MDTHSQLPPSMVKFLSELSSSIAILSGINIAFFIAMTVTLALRLYTRLKIVRVFEAEDWTIVIAYILAVTATIITFVDTPVMYRTTHGDFSDILYSGKLILSSIAVYIASDMVTRISFGYFFLTIFHGHNHKRTRIFIWFTMISVLVTGLVYIPLMVVKGHGADAFSVTIHVYRDDTLFYESVVYTCLVIFGDFTLTALAIYIIFKIRLPMIGKFSAGFLLAIQCLSGVASILRLVYSFRIRQNFTQDVAIESLRLSHWSLVEVGLGIVTANMALTRPLFLHLQKKFFPKPIQNDVVSKSIGSRKENGSVVRSVARSSFEIVKTQVITVVSEDVDMKGYDGLCKTGLVGDSFSEANRAWYLRDI